MDNLEYIENYFKSSNSNTDKEAFEKRIMSDASFAEEVAFYISANGLIQQQIIEEKKQRFKSLYSQGKVIQMNQPVKNTWKYLAAASIIIAVILVTWFLSGNKNSTKQLADTYIDQNFKTLGVIMGNGDSIQTGLDLFNANKLTEALPVFENLSKNNPANSTIKKYTGIVYLRLKNYDKALENFSTVEADKNLYSNPGKFYKAITLFERNNSGDKEAAKLLLEEVKDGNLEGKDNAEEWLKKF